MRVRELFYTCSLYRVMSHGRYAYARRNFFFEFWPFGKKQTGLVVTHEPVKSIQDRSRTTAFHFFYENNENNDDGERGCVNMGLGGFSFW